MKTKKLCIAIVPAFAFMTTISLAQQTEPIIVASAENITEPLSISESKEEDEPEPSFTLSGSIDTYFRSSFGTYNPYLGGYGPTTSFGDLKGFGLGMANLVASYGGEKAGFTADLVFGPRGQAAVFGTASGQAVINQMYAYYKLSNAVTLNMGQFNTFLGYEVISPAVNFHYSTSYLFSWGPFSHSGLRADIDLGNGLGLKLAVMNPTDIVEFNPVNTYTIGGQIGKTTDAGGIWVNALYGDQDGKLNTKDDPYVYDDNGDIAGFIASAGALFQVDVTTGWNLSEKFYLGFNTSHQSVSSGEEFVAEGSISESEGNSTSFTGIAVYPKVTLSETFSLGARAEYFAIKKGHLDLFTLDEEGSGSVTAVTISANYKVGALTVIPEFRIDTTSEDSFLDADNKATDKLASIALAAVYKF
ncbi:MAG TPA: outer membrane beta-barrel protein [Chryseosolibacter sp.]|nr:outer membrane beta-barrel protein [Chryseosolibacter sp.]